MKKLLRILLILLVILIAAFFIFRTPDTDRTEMIAKYGNEASQFLDDGSGGQIHYRDQGNKDGPVIVLIHGSNGHVQTWDALIEMMQDEFRLISLDLYGHGLTGPNSTANYGAEAMISAVAKVLDQAEVEKAVWVGNSMGGWLSWRAALAVPDRVSGLVLVDASGAQAAEKVKPYLGARLARSAIGQLLLPEITPRSLVKSSLEENYASPELITEELVDRYWEMLRFPGNRRAAVDRAGVNREPDKWNDVGDIKVPVLLLWGDQDSVVPVSHGKAFDSAIPDSRLIVYPDAGHLPMEETPEQVARDIGIWVKANIDQAELVETNGAE
ncbi:MAG: alpha/beta hydrolase [Parasphingorhabdus sp.]